jgi:hypothetical protein
MSKKSVKIRMTKFTPEHKRECGQGPLYWKIPPGGEYQRMSFGGKNMKRQREKKGKNVK